MPRWLGCSAARVSSAALAGGIVGIRAGPDASEAQTRACPDLREPAAGPAAGAVDNARSEQERNAARLEQHIATLQDTVATEMAAAQVEKLRLATEAAEKSQNELTGALADLSKDVRASIR